MEGLGVVRKRNRSGRPRSTAKYFAHGVPFAAVMLPFGLAAYYSIRTHSSLEPDWLPVLVGESMAAVLLLSFGLANLYLARVIWGIRLKKTFINIFVQGGIQIPVMAIFVLFWMFLAIEEDNSIVIAAFITFVSNAVISGYAGRYLAVDIASLRKSKEKPTSLRSRRQVCPNCGTSFVSRDQDDWTCPECHTVLHEGDGRNEPDSG